MSRPIDPPVIKMLSVPDNDPFSGGYRGFRYAAWNHAEPFEPSRLGDQAHHDKDNLRDYEGSDPDDEERRDEIRQEPSSGRKLLAMTPLPSGTGLTADPDADPDAVEPACVAGEQSVYITRGEAHSARMGGRIGGRGENSSPPEDADLEETDVASALSPKDYGRLTISRSFFQSASVSSFNGSLSSGTVKTTTDVADLNGDGIADVVAAGRTEPGNVPREGRGDFTPATGQSTGGAFRERRTNSYSLGLGINPIVFDTSSSGRGLSSNTRMPSDSGGGGGGSGSLGGGAGLGVTRSATTREVLDLKGDGLPA